MDQFDSAEHVIKLDEQIEQPETSMTNSAYQRSLSRQHDNLYQNFLSCPRELVEKSAPRKGTRSSNSDKSDQKLELRH